MTDLKPILIRIASNPLYTQMNKTERAWAAILEARRLTGAVMEWKYQAVKLRLGGGSYYTPDFCVVCMRGAQVPGKEPVGVIEFHEVKGFWREASRVRIKVAAAEYPWALFKAVVARSKKDGGGWEIEEIPSRPLGVTSS